VQKDRVPPPEVAIEILYLARSLRLDQRLVDAARSQGQYTHVLIQTKLAPTGGYVRREPLVWQATIVLARSTRAVGYRISRRDAKDILMVPCRRLITAPLRAAMAITSRS